MTTQGLNDTRKADLMKRIAGYGKAEGEGRNARPDFGRDVFLSTADGVIETDKQAAEIYGKYAAANVKATEITGKVDTDAKSLAAQVSKMKNFITVGAMPFFKVKDGQEDAAKNFMARIEKAIATLAANSDKAVPVYASMVSVMVEQKKKVSERKIAAPLTDDEIVDAITPTKNVEGEQACLERMRKQLQTFANKAGFADSAKALNNAADALTPRINALALIAEGKDAALVWAKLSPEAQAAIISKSQPAPIEAPAE